MYLIAQHIRFSVIVHISEGSVGQIEGFVCVEEMFVWHQKKKTHQCMIYMIRRGNP